MGKEAKDGAIEILGSATKWFVVWCMFIHFVSDHTGPTMDVVEIATLAAIYTVAQGVATTVMVILATLAVGSFE